MGLSELNSRYFVTTVRRKKKGAGKGYKEYVDLCFNESLSRRDYLAEFAAIDRRGCGLFLCRIEQSELDGDRWWDVPGYREEHLRGYRGRIEAIRDGYGLSSSDVAKFMAV